MVEPCFCFRNISRHKGALIMAGLTISRAIICLISVSTFLTIYLLSKETVLNILNTINFELDFVNLPKTTVIGLTSFLISVFIFEIPLYTYLFISVLKKNAKRVDEWCNRKMLLIGVAVLFGICVMILSKDRLYVGILIIIVLIYDFYLILVLKSYANEEKLLNSKESNSSELR